MMTINNFFKPAYSSLLCFAFLLPLLPQTVQNGLYSDACQTKNTTFLAGEELVYKIYYNWNFVWLSAGEVTFRVSEKGNQYHYKAIGETYPSYEWFFEVDDEYNSWVSKETLLPTASEKSVKEGKYKLYEKVRYDQSTKKASVLRSEEKGMKDTTTYHTMTNCVHDVLSILYNMRNHDYSNAPVGQSEEFSLFLDQKQYDLNMKYLGKDQDKRIKGFGRFNTLKFQPQLITGDVFKEDAQMTIWVGDDKNRIPVLIESPVSVGSVKVVLKSYKNTKFDVTSKLK